MEYPYIVIELCCSLYPWRRGRYQLARLAERFGADADRTLVRRRRHQNRCGTGILAQVRTDACASA